MKTTWKNRFYTIPFNWIYRYHHRSVVRGRPPINSLLERQARGGSMLATRPADMDQTPSPYPRDWDRERDHNPMDRTHISMSVANTSFQSDAFGDISGFSDNNFGSYSGIYLYIYIYMFMYLYIYIFIYIHIYIYIYIYIFPRKKRIFFSRA
jgi:hypothetical protein